MILHCKNAEIKILLSFQHFQHFYICHAEMTILLSFQHFYSVKSYNFCYFFFEFFLSFFLNLAVFYIVENKKGQFFFIFEMQKFGLEDP